MLSTRRKTPSLLWLISRVSVGGSDSCVQMLAESIWSPPVLLMFLLPRRRCLLPTPYFLHLSLLRELVVFVLRGEEGAAGGDAAAAGFAVGNHLCNGDGADGKDEGLVADGDRTVVDALVVLVDHVRVFLFGLRDEAYDDAGARIDVDLDMIGDAVLFAEVPDGVGLEVATLGPGNAERISGITPPAGLLDIREAAHVHSQVCLFLVDGIGEDCGGPAADGFPAHQLDAARGLRFGDHGGEVGIGVHDLDHLIAAPLSFVGGKGLLP